MTAGGGGITAGLIDLLAVFIIAGGVGIFVAKVGRFPYTIALLFAGFAVSIGVSLTGDGGASQALGTIPLSHDIILLVLLPPLLFEGAATTDLEAFRENFPVIITLAVVGLVSSILLVGAAATRVLGMPLLVALLFATIVLPTDPVSVLALFEEIGAPERLAVLVEGESLLNDGVAVVIFVTLYDLVAEGATVEDLLTLDSLARVVIDVVFSGLGGALVGFAAAFVVYSVMRDLDEHMTEIVLTLILAYGAFILAEHYVPQWIGIQFSGVIATVVAGLFIGNRGAEEAMSPQTKLSIFNTWETFAFIVNTFIFVLIGARTPVSALVENIAPLGIAIGLALVGRAIPVYVLTNVVNKLQPRQRLSLSYQHVLVWGGLHASIPIALVLGIPSGEASPLTQYGSITTEQLRVLVFGIAAFSLVVQGLTMAPLIRRLGIITTTEEERLYQLLIGRARAVDEALDAADELEAKNEIPEAVYDRFTAEYESEKADLNRAIARLLDDHPEIRDRELLGSERRLLKQEQSAIKSAELNGVLTSDVAERLLQEVHLKLDQVHQGQTTVHRDPDEEGYEEFWREEAHEYGLLEEEEDESDDEDEDTETTEE
ncbi:cation:proton antiporter [Haloarchaeobius amylolyticus]|uniref:cation:proton antiporter n=1 Tax=Haloarchaeobius amylolyticus TaxID=1198296 RepID=UPI00226D4678|nr:cation:proton antiporter [Haloarchaeobius amylolyticus]